MRSAAGRPPERVQVAISMFSATVRSAKIPLSSGAQPTPSCAISCVRRPWMGWPRNSTRPACGRRYPMIVRRVVVFPAPFLPTRQTTSRGPTSSDTDLKIWLAWMNTSSASTVSTAGRSPGPRAPADDRVGGERREEARAAPEARDHRRLERLQHREVGKDLDELEGPRDPEAGQAGGSEPAHVAIFEGDGARGRPEDAGEDVDERGLARPIRPDDRHELSCIDGEAHAVEGADLAVELPQPHGAEDHGRGAAAGRGVRSPASPPGAKMTMTARIAPKISRQNGMIDITQS